MAGEEVVQLYVADVVASVTPPVKSLKGFARVSLEPGQTQTVAFTLTPEHLAILDRNLKPVVEPGEFRITVGPDSTRGLTTSLWVR